MNQILSNSHPLLNAENIQLLVRIHKFDFAACAAFANERIGPRQIKADDIRMAFASNSDLQLNQSELSNKRIHKILLEEDEQSKKSKKNSFSGEGALDKIDKEIGQIKSIDTIDLSHHSRCNAAFLKAASSIIGSNVVAECKANESYNSNERHRIQDGHIDAILNEQSKNKQRKIFISQN